MAYFTIEGYNSYSGCDISVTAALPMINGQQMDKYYSLGSLQTLSISTHQDKRPVRSLGVINAKDYVMGPRTIAGSMVFAVFNKHFASQIMADLGASGSDVILPDEIPALNITINFANEYGRMSRMAIYGVKLLNEGQVMSINDLYTENTYQFVALGLEPLNVNINESEGSTIVEKPGSSITKYWHMNDTTIVISPTDRLINGSTTTIKPTNRIPIDRDYMVIDPTTRKPIKTDKYKFPEYTDDLVRNPWEEESGKNIKDILDNYKPIGTLPGGINNQYEMGDSILLQVKTQRPTDENELGLATFTLDPPQKEGVINIVDLSNKDNTNGDSNDLNAPNIKKFNYSINIANKTNYIIALPASNYMAQFVSPINEYSNIVDFTTDRYISYDNVPSEITYPFIEKVTDDEILISNGDYNHTKLSYFEPGGLLKTCPIEKKPVLIDNLQEDKNYMIYTSSGESSTFSRLRSENLYTRSELINIKTHKIDHQPLQILKDFISTNQNLLISSLDDMLIALEGLDYNKYYTLIDLVLTLPESLEKQELLIYANELTRQLITSYNLSNKNHILDVIQRTPFDPVIKINSFNKANYYNCDNYKSALNKTVNPMQEDFYAKPNKHYCVHAIDDGIKTVKQDFAICRPSAYEYLHNYCEVERYKNINLDSYITTYSKYDYNTMEAIAIKDNCYSDINILKPPYIYKNEEDGHIHADVKYLNLKHDTTYYLVCSELYSALDYKPKRKVPFTLEIQDIDLNYEYLGMLPNKKYVFWIENSDFIKISKAHLFVYKEDKNYGQVQDIYRKDLQLYLTKLKKELVSVIGNKSMVTDLINYVISMNPADKNINNTLESEFINTFTNSLYISDVLYPLFSLIQITHEPSNINLDAKIKINLIEKTVSLTTHQDFYLCAIQYNNDEVVRLQDDNKFASLDSEGYTLIYLVNDYMFYKTGFILIDNKSGRYLATADMLNYIEQVGDN